MQVSKQLQAQLPSTGLTGPMREELANATAELEAEAIHTLRYNHILLYNAATFSLLLLRLAGANDPVLYGGLLHSSMRCDFPAHNTESSE